NNCCLSSSLNIPISEIGSDTVRIDSNSVWKFSNILSIVLPSNRSLLYCKIPPKFSSSFPSSTTVVVLLNMVNVKSNLVVEVSIWSCSLLFLLLLLLLLSLTADDDDDVDDVDDVVVLSLTTCPAAE